MMLYVNNSNHKFSTYVDLSKNYSLDNSIFVDSHPSDKSLIWSKDYYLFNPYYFLQLSPFKPIKTFSINISNPYISYFINSTITKNKLYTDILTINSLFPNKTIKFFSYVQQQHPSFNINIITRFSLEQLFDCMIVITNEISTIFVPAFYHNTNVMIIDIDPLHYCSIFFLKHLNNIYTNTHIHNYIHYLKEFTIRDTDEIDVLKHPIIKKHLSVEYEYYRKCITNQKSFKNIFIHSQCRESFLLFYNSINTSKFNLINYYDDNSLVCIVLDEDGLSKKLLLSSSSRIIAFDLNHCIIHSQQTEYYRYYIQSFNSVFLPQHHCLDKFKYNEDISVDDNGVIICLLDNSTGLFYKTQSQWFDNWVSIFEFLTKTYLNKILVKVHPNDSNNILLKDLIKSFNLEITTNIFCHNIFFCVINNGSFYYKSTQLGYLLLSPKHNQEKCIYNLYQHINTSIQHFKQFRKSIFTSLLNTLVDRNDLLNGSFFNQLFNYFNKGPDDIKHSNSVYCVDASVNV